VSKRSKLLIVTLLVLVLSLLVAWRGLAAQDILSGRNHPDFQQRVSGVVAISSTSSSPILSILPQPLKNLVALLLDVPVGPNVLANQDATSQAQNEPSIAVNPHNPNHVVASSNDYRLVDVGLDVHPGYYVSFDGGNTWPGDGVIDLSTIPNGQAGGDPSMAIHDVNNVYFGYIAFNRTIDNAGGVYVSKSTDGGLTWGDPVPVALNTLTIFQDKDYITVDATGGPHDGNVYVTWTRFASDYPIYFSRSTDGGASFSAGVKISDASLNSCQGSIPVVGPNGEIYVAWLNYDTSAIRLTKSLDGGLTFSTPVKVADISEIPSPLPGGSFRNDSFPSMAVDPTNGYVYVVWSDYRNGDADIYFTRSTDGGTTWSTPLRINDDTLGNDFHQFFPWIATSPNGKVYASWFDSRNDPNPYQQPFIYDEYAVASTDHGATFGPNVRISEVSSDASIGFGGQFIGDYSSLAATSNFIFPAWVDTRRSNQDIFTQSNPLLLEASKTAPDFVDRNLPFTYTIEISSSDAITSNLLADPLPPEVTYVPDSLWASSGNYTETNGVIYWDGDLTGGLPLTITFLVTPTAFCSTPITNTAVFTAGQGMTYELNAYNQITGTMPVADFLPSDFAPHIGQIVTFTNQSTGGDPLDFLWSFGDGITSTQDSPTHSFDYPGFYTVTLTATDACGYASHEEVLQVTCDAPTPFFTWTGGELAITFTNQSTGTFPLDFLWTFGDGLTSTEEAPSHFYEIPAPYSVTLTATDLCGSASYTALVNATCSAPEAAFSWLGNDLQVTFTNQSTGRFPLDFFWGFGDGLTSTLVSPVHDFALPGPYTATLTATDLCGVGTVSDLVTASCPVPEASFTWVADGMLVTFTNQSTGTFPLSFEWDFGDGLTSTLDSPAHTYAQTGTYTVQLTVTEACGVNTYEMTIHVGRFFFLPITFNH
jgi:PKD repeat protein